MAKKTIKTPAAADEPERNALVTKIEGDLPYNKEVYVNEVRFYLNQTAGSIIEAGKRLLIIKEKEGHGNFMQIVEDLGLSYRSAARFMHTALKSGKFPAIKVANLANLSNVYTLLEAPEEDLKQLEEQGVLAGKTMDELSAMSVKDMRDLIRQHRTERDALVEQQTGKIKKENQMLKTELKDFHKIIPNYSKDMSKAEMQLHYALNKYEEFEAAMNGLCFNTMEIEDAGISAKIDGTLKTMHTRIFNFAEKWEKHKKGDIQS